VAKYRVYRQHLLTYQVAREVMGGIDYVSYVIGGVEHIHMKRWLGAENRMTAWG